MKTTVVLLSVLAFASCQTGAQQASDELTSGVLSATDDDMVTPKEAVELRALAMNSVDAGGSFDWATLAGTAFTSILGALVGVKMLPSRAFVGPFDKRKA